MTGRRRLWSNRTNREKSLRKLKTTVDCETNGGKVKKKKEWEEVERKNNNKKKTKTKRKKK